MRQHSTAQHSTAQHSTAQHSTAQHSTAQHSAAQEIFKGHLQTGRFEGFSSCRSLLGWKFSRHCDYGFIDLFGIYDKQVPLRGAGHIRGKREDTREGSSSEDRGGLCHAIYVMLRHTVSGHISLCYVMSCHVMSCHVMSRKIIWIFVILRCNHLLVSEKGGRNAQQVSKDLTELSISCEWGAAGALAASSEWVSESVGYPAIAEGTDTAPKNEVLLVI